MRVLITGSTGMLGGSLLRTFAGNSKYEVWGMGRSLTRNLPGSRQIVADFSRPVAREMVPFRPDCIIHTAALTDLALCEREPQLAETVHVDATRDLVRILGRTGRFIYISTDSVFDGEKGNYSENDPPRPLNIYAATKLKGEQAAREGNVDPVIIRTNIYGSHNPMKGSLAEWAMKTLKHGEKINGFSDIMFNAVYTGQLSGILKNLLDEDVHAQVLNVGSSTTISKYTFLCLLARQLDIDEHQVESRDSSEFPSSLKRPRNTSLNTKRLSDLYSVPSFEDGIAQCVAFAQTLW